jgi:predicted O-linked N-acetylglucosamine transferase (SPINDLY family)
LAARSNEQFAQIALELAGDAARLAELRSILRRRMLDSPLCDAVKFTRNVEAAYRRMCHIS